MAIKRLKNGQIRISSRADMVEALERHVEIEEEIADKVAESAELKKAANEYAAENGYNVIQLTGSYFRQIVRHTRKWIGTPDDIPVNAVGSVKALSEIVEGKKVNGKPLWQLVTKRVPDPDAINDAVGRGWITPKEIEPAYAEIPSSPYLKKFNGRASDG